MDVHEKFAIFFDNKKIRPFAFLISKKLAEGHICIRNTENYTIDFEESIFSGENLDWKELENNNLVSSSLNDKKPFIYLNGNLYLYRYYSYESRIIDDIKKLTQGEKALENERKKFLLANKDLITKLQVQNKDLDKEDLSIEEKVDWQLVACINSFLNNFSIITGGPGTGKTTTIAKLLALFYKENPELKIALAAPTGKAGNRMIESIKINPEIEKFELRGEIEKLKPFTIHRLLGFKRNSPYFKHDENTPLNYDVVIVDEASMIDLALFSKLINAVKSTCRIIFLGDKEQLASVEAGSLFGDLCGSLPKLNQFEKEDLVFINQFLSKENIIPNVFESQYSEALLFNHIVELKRSYRFHSKSEIGNLSKAIINSDKNTVAEFFQDKVDIEIDTDYKESSIKEFISHFGDYINEKDPLEAIKILNNAKILCAVKNGPNGVYEINKKVESFLKIKGLRTNELFYENRPVLVTKNNKDLDLFNGDIGIVRDGEVCFIDRENKLYKVKPALLPECETVFAMTIHKSQGSEYKHVLVVLPQVEENRLLTKELLYTAVTRATSKVLIQATQEVVFTTIRQSVSRASGITERIK